MGLEQSRRTTLVSAELVEPVFPHSMYGVRMQISNILYMTDCCSRLVTCLRYLGTFSSRCFWSGHTGYCYHAYINDVVFLADKEAIVTLSLLLPYRVKMTQEASQF